MIRFFQYKVLIITYFFVHTVMPVLYYLIAYSQEGFLLRGFVSNILVALALINVMFYFMKAHHRVCIDKQGVVIRGFCRTVIGLSWNEVENAHFEDSALAKISLGGVILALENKDGTKKIVFQTNRSALSKILELCSNEQIIEKINRSLR